MSSNTFILLGVTYFIIAFIIIIVVLTIINKKEKNKYQLKFNELERNKNLIISAGILSELNKVEGLINNQSLQEKFDDWKVRFNEIKEVDLPKIDDQLLEIEELHRQRKSKELKAKLAETEYQIYFIKTKTNYLLNEIKEITLSEDRNRGSITKLKAKYREIVANYNNNKDDFNLVSGPIELQFDRVDKLFSAFEVTIDNNNYQEVNKIVKVLDDVIGNLDLVIKEAPGIIMLGTKVLPAKIKDVELNATKLIQDGFNIDYLNIDYNIEEANKKIKDILERLNVLNIEDSTLDLKTILDYYESLYDIFDKERNSRKVFSDYQRTILSRTLKYDKITNDLARKISEFKYSYDLTDEDMKIIPVIHQELKEIRIDYDQIIEAYRSKKYAFSRLSKEMDTLNNRLINTKEKLDEALNSIGNLKEDEVRAREQLKEIKEILRKAQHRIVSYKLPVIPKKYYVELSEAKQAVKEMVKELNTKPISIKTLNIRVDTARDLVLKVYNTANNLVKTAYMAEMAVVYGNRFRIVNRDLDESLNMSESYYFKGDFKKSLENSINAINVIEPNFYDSLMSILEEQVK